MNYLDSRRIRADLSRRQIHLLSPVCWRRVADGGCVAKYRWVDVENELVLDLGWARPDAQAFLMDCFLAGLSDANALASNEGEVWLDAA